MPGRDGTGPMGAGPMTGRRAGYCAGYRVPGANDAARCSGFGFRGGGRGRRNMFYATGLPGWQRFSYAPTDSQEEAEALKAQTDWLKGQLDAIEKRIKELEQESA